MELLQKGKEQIGWFSPNFWERWSCTIWRMQ